tara:strand:- start:1316 stop:1828 length:513 start_codon:yes stop_codon:yes gene_type:complete
MKKLILLLLFIPLVITCSSDSDNNDNNDNNEAVLGVDNMSEYLEGKYFRYSLALTFDGFEFGGDTVSLYYFEDEGVKTKTWICGAFGEVCNSSANGGGEGCHNICETEYDLVIIDLPEYMEYDNGERIQLVDGELRFIRISGMSLLFTPSSEDELNNLLNEFPADCGGSC